MQALDRRWPAGGRWIDALWVLFWIANLAAMDLVPRWETVPFHFIWVSLTLLYGFRVWKVRPTLAVLALVAASTAALIGIDVVRGAQPPDELTEVPLMSAMFLAMVWHARRRLIAMGEMEGISNANRRLLERERRFLQDASHELRTPITVALGHAELVLRDAADASVRQDAAVITDELMRLRRLADRLLILAGAEDPGFLHPVPVELEDFLVETAQRWAATPRRWRLAGAEEATVLADRDRLAVALDALIENAVNHTREQDAIELGVERRDGVAVISVRDTGAGIPAAHLGRIFDRFARADPGRSRETGGAGLGLSIVRAIVEAHGGLIHADSEEGRGARFDVILPIATTTRRTSAREAADAAN